MNATGPSTARLLDQFYTRPDVARRCVAWLTDTADFGAEEWLWIEPSAGRGAFVDAIPPPCVALDIAPGRADIVEADFLAWRATDPRKTIVVGNPPFGKNASLARKFFDHAATFADRIAFILPKTFQKPAFVNRLDRWMHLVAELPLEGIVFELEGEPYAVPTTFQLWERRSYPRSLSDQPLRHPHFSFVGAKEAHFAFQRVGARAGLVSHEGLRKSPQSHYFIRSNIGSEAVFSRLRSIDWTPVKCRTAGNPSIGKGELVSTYEAMLD